MRLLLTLLPLAASDISADAPPPGFELWLRNLLYLAGIAFFLWSMLDKMRRKPSIDVEIKGFATKDEVQRIEVRMPTFATKEDVQNVADGCGEAIDEAVKHLDGRRSQSIAGVHSKIDETERSLSAKLGQTREEVAKVVTEAETHTRQLGTLQATQERILERLPRRTS